MTKTKLTKQVKHTNLSKLAKLSAFAFFYFAFISFSSAQLRLVPLQRQGIKTKATNSSARTMSVEPLKLPFLEDFSKPMLSSSGKPLGVPDTSKWVNSRSVWVNNGMAIDPPSIYVATLDGLDSLNAPYEDKLILLNGFTDKLVSKPIDLSLADVNSTYLSFQYQWAGNGEPPDPTDYIQLDFKTDQNIWETVKTITGADNQVDSIFKQVLVKVDGSDARFFHDAFQFRFMRYGRKSGPFDTWNLDYIYLNSGRNDSDSSFTDLATISEISPLFGLYRAMPLSHFMQNKKIDSVYVDIRNLYKEGAITDYNVDGKFYNYYTDPSSVQITNTNIQSTKTFGEVPAFDKSTIKLATLPDVSNTTLFDPNADSIIIKLKFKAFSNSNGADIITTNDTISAVFKLKDYYAYDDGIAEYSVVLNQPGNKAVAAFDFDIPKDTLIAVDIYFPDFSLESNQTVDITVYNDEDGKPGSILSTHKSYSIQRKGLNNFSRISIPPIEIKNRFYIGWTEPSNGKVKVGFDNSNNTGDKIFVNTGSTWLQNTDVEGSLMIRPVFGSGEIVTGIDETNKPEISFYPNPNNGTFMIKGNYDALHIISPTGQLIPYQSENVNDDRKITIQAAPGLYLIKIQKGKTSTCGKLIVR